MSDTITITIDREVAEAHAHGRTTLKQRLAVDDACREALTNPPTETPELPEAGPHGEFCGFDHNAIHAAGVEHGKELAALSQTPEAAQEESQSVSEGVNDDAIRLIEAALLKADHELRNGGAHRDAFSILSAAMNQLRIRLIATNPSPPTPEDGGWQPIETAPKDGTYVVVGYWLDLGRHVWIGNIARWGITREQAERRARRDIAEQQWRKARAQKPRERYAATYRASAEGGEGE